MNQTPAHIAHGAAIAIRACGLWRNEFFPGWLEARSNKPAAWDAAMREYSGPPPMCTLGAIRFAANGTAASEGADFNLDPVFDALADHLLGYAEREGLDTESCDVIVAWSDDPGRTADEVAAALESAAIALTVAP